LWAAFILPIGFEYSLLTLMLIAFLLSRKILDKNLLPPEYREIIRPVDYGAFFWALSMMVSNLVMSGRTELPTVVILKETLGIFNKQWLWWFCVSRMFFWYFSTFRDYRWLRSLSIYMGI